MTSQSDVVTSGNGVVKMCGPKHDVGDMSSVGDVESVSDMGELVGDPGLCDVGEMANSAVCDVVGQRDVAGVEPTEPIEADVA